MRSTATTSPIPWTWITTTCGIKALTTIWLYWFPACAGGGVNMGLCATIYEFTIYKIFANEVEPCRCAGPCRNGWTGPTQNHYPDI
jgi:hypothetical protein